MFSKPFTVNVVICLQSCFQGCEYLLLIWLDVLPRLRSVIWHLCMLKHILFKWARASRYSRQLIILSLFTSVALKKFFSSVIVKYRLFCSEFSVWYKTEAILTSTVQKISAECQGIRLMTFLKVSAPNRLDETNKRCYRNFKLQASFLAWLLVKWFLILAS